MSLSSLLPPQLNDLLDSIVDETLEKVNAVKLGTIQSVDSSVQSCTVKIAYKRTDADGKVVEYPLLVDVPYFVLQGGGAFIEFPLAKGDKCLLLFSDREIDNFWAKGNITTTSSARKHSLSDAVALVGISTKTAPLSLLGNVLRLYSGSAKIELQNATVTFSTWLQGFIQAIMDQVDTHGDTLSPATIAALSAKKTEIANLFGS